MAKFVPSISTVYSLEKCQWKVMVHFILLLSQDVLCTPSSTVHEQTDEKVKVALTLPSLLWVGHNKNHSCLLRKPCKCGGLATMVHSNDNSNSTEWETDITNGEIERYGAKTQLQNEMIRVKINNLMCTFMSYALFGDLVILNRLINICWKWTRPLVWAHFLL